MKYAFEWFEKEDRRRVMRASVGRDGKLRLGRLLRTQLPPCIRIGFDARCMALAIADGHGEGIDWPRCGTITAQALSASLTSAGLRLPVSFRLARDEATGYLVGRVVPRRRREADGRLTFDLPQLLVLYRHIVEDAAARMAKSTPLAERRTAAVEALYEAAQAYGPGCGELEPFLEERICRELAEQNRQYTPGYRDRSLEQPLVAGEDFCLYDTQVVSDGGGIREMEERIMLEQFLETLAPRERRLVDLLQKCRTLRQIGEALGLDTSEVRKLAAEVAQKRRRFYEAD